MDIEYPRLCVDSICFTIRLEIFYGQKQPRLYLLAIISSRLYLSLSHFCRLFIFSLPIPALIVPRTIPLLLCLSEQSFYVPFSTCAKGHSRQIGWSLLSSFHPLIALLVLNNRTEKSSGLPRENNHLFRFLPVLFSLRFPYHFPTKPNDEFLMRRRVSCNKNFVFFFSKNFELRIFS